jgi:DNA-directed RNA polymerase subunit N (RpoN/RPB10)
MAKRKSIHYVNNADFSQAVVEYVEKVQEAKKNKQQLPIVPDYIAQCFLKISEGLSHKSNFIRYTYREEMVMDSVENCLKAINNYNLEAATRTGKPNAFAYFTQIAWYAFLRRIAKEKKQQDVKLKYLAKSGIENFVDLDTADQAAGNVISTFVDTLRDRIDKVKQVDEVYDDLYKTEKRKRKTKLADSDLTEFME